MAEERKTISGPIAALVVNMALTIIIVTGKINM